MDQNIDDVTRKRAERLKDLLEEHKLSQAALAGMIHFSPVTVSKAVTGKRITDGFVHAVAEKFPMYDAEYLLGHSDFKNEEDRYNHEADMQSLFAEGEKINREAFEMYLFNTAIRAGYEIDDGSIDCDGSELGKYSLTKLRGELSGRSVPISLEYIEDIRDEIEAIIIHKLQKAIRNGGR